MSFSERDTQALAQDDRRAAMVVGLRALINGEIHALAGEPRRWVIGSGASCDVVVRDPFVSSTHCVLERRPAGGLVVRDRKSRNGTFVDGNPIEGADLRVGSYLTVGRTTLVATAAPGAPRSRALDLLRGSDPALRTIVDQALRAAQTDCNVLIVGETGTGKELIARIVHEGSKRSPAPFVAVNCGAIPRELVGSELFGHERGAFTGAVDARDGVFVEANAGSLFLDEIGELPIELQPTLLRALETRRIRRVGGSIDRAVDVRIIAATNQLSGLGTESARLRLDLYHRLATVVLALPPLRERMSDLGELVEVTLDELADHHGRRTISDDAWRALAAYNWPGNVRELRNAVARAVAIGGSVLERGDFFPDLGLGRSRLATGTEPPPPGELVDPTDPGGYDAKLMHAMAQALAAYGSIRAAAISMGMPKSTFADRARAWGLHPRRKIRIYRKGFQPK